MVATGLNVTKRINDEILDYFFGRLMVSRLRLSQNDRFLHRRPGYKHGHQLKKGLKIQIW